jgi:hypothetical protein
MSDEREPAIPTFTAVIILRYLRPDDAESRPVVTVESRREAEGE